MSHGNRSEQRSRGAAMVEFALVLPLLLVLIFGIMEAGWFFAQQVEVNNAAREGARLAVVDYPGPDMGDSIVIRNEVCSRAELSAERARVAVDYDSTADSVTFTVRQQYQSLTGFIPSFNGAVIDSTVEMRNERDTLTWSPIAITSVDSPCP